MKSLLSIEPVWQSKGIALVRIIFGALIIYHGHEVFRSELMNSYLEWGIFNGPNGKLLVYAGKTSELIAGLSIFFGFFTRLGALLTMGTLAFITFFVGQGRFWYEDQHPFMFVLLALMFFFTGPGSWSVDGHSNKEEALG